MMNKVPTQILRIGLLGLILSMLAGCSHLVGAVRSEPIKDTPAKRTFGRYIDDQIVETKALVNLRKADPQLKESHLVVVSYNGIVLLTGQVPSEALRKKSGRNRGSHRHRAASTQRAASHGENHPAHSQ